MLRLDSMFPEYYLFVGVNRMKLLDYAGMSNIWQFFSKRSDRA